MDAVRLRSPFEDLLAVSDWRATAAQRAVALPRSQASFRMRAWQVDALDACTLARLYALAFQHSIATPSGESAAVLRRRVEEAVERGLVLLIARPRAPLTVALAEDPTAAEVLGPGPERQDVEFDLEYFDGTPVSGVRYVLVDSGGAKEKGVFGAHGVVQRRDVAGTYSLAIEEIDRIDWSAARIRAGETVTLATRTSGIDDGASLTIRIYRLHDEEPGHEVATLSATVQQGRAQTSWKRPPPSRDESGIASFVAEASLDDGRVWQKSPPLDVELPAVVGAEWSQARVAPGEDVDLVVHAAGFPDGTEVAVALFRHVVDGDDAKVGDVLSSALKGSEARATLRCGDAALPARAGDVYARVTIRGSEAERTGCSPLLWVDTASAAANVA